jgi:HD-like signal output (HDOD) protein
VTTTTIDHEVLRARVRRTFARLSLTGELPALPAAATAALGLARDPNSDIEALVSLIRADVALAARVLRVANSGAYARRKAARTLTEAIGTIGLRKTCDLLVVAFTRDLYRGSDPVVRALWDHALLSAIAIEELARVTRSMDPASAFLPGLFHDVGRLTFLLADPAAGHLIRELGGACDDEMRQAESEWFGFSHAEASAILAGDWGLDATQTDAIRWHHEPDRAGPGKTLARLLAAADRVARGLGYGIDGTEADAATAEGTTLTGLAADDDARCVARVRELFAEQRALFG